MVTEQVKGGLAPRPGFEPHSITVIGREWRDRQAGNTYHSITILVNGHFVGPTREHGETMSYGGDSMYEESAAEWLEKEGYIQRVRYSSGGKQTLWRYCEEHGITYYRTSVPVSRRKDL